jgi:catechol 2,3-dioxygenase-like lactoylglutathione lyase family enzyme
MEVRADVTVAELGDFRWLVVGPVGQDVGLVLMTVPGEPAFDEETRAQIESLVARGGTGGLFLHTDDCHASYEELKGRGVEFTLEPTKAPYGIDAAFRDPSGNPFRLVEEHPLEV